MEIRNATASDVSAIVAVDHVAADDIHRRQNIHDWVTASHAIIATTENVVVGYSVLEYNFFGCGFVPMLLVTKEYRRKGVATALLTHLEERCRTEKLFTSTNQSNKPMQALMKRLCYERSGTIYNLDDGDPELFYIKRFQRTQKEKKFPCTMNGLKVLNPNGKRSTDSMNALHEDRGAW